MARPREPKNDIGISEVPTPMPPDAPVADLGVANESQLVLIAPLGSGDVGTEKGTIEVKDGKITLDASSAWDRALARQLIAHHGFTEPV